LLSNNFFKRAITLRINSLWRPQILKNIMEDFL